MGPGPKRRKRETEKGCPLTALVGVYWVLCFVSSRNAVSPRSFNTGIVEFVVFNQITGRNIVVVKVVVVFGLHCINALPPSGHETFFFPIMQSSILAFVSAP